MPVSIPMPHFMYILNCLFMFPFSLCLLFSTLCSVDLLHEIVLLPARLSRVIRPEHPNHPVVCSHPNHSAKLVNSSVSASRFRSVSTSSVEFLLVALGRWLHVRQLMDFDAFFNQVQLPVYQMVLARCIHWCINSFVFFGFLLVTVYTYLRNRLLVNRVKVFHQL